MSELDGAIIIRPSDMLVPQVVQEPKIDEMISKIVGRKIYQLDPRVMKLVVKWKKENPNPTNANDNWLQDPRKVEELKEALSGNL